MKKFLCMTMLMLAALTASAMAQTKAASPPEQDIGYQQVATLSLDGMTVYAIHSQLNIVDWQIPVMVAQEASTASAQVVGAVTIAPIDPLYQGEEITMLLMPMLVNV